MTLIAERPPTYAAAAGAAFAGPTFVHFGAILLLAAQLHAPWQTITIPATLWGIVGFSGVAYAVIVARLMRRQAAYATRFEDWLFHVALPLAAYAKLALSPFSTRSHARQALFGVGAAALLLLFVGIHNAWDNVTYHVLVNSADAEAERLRDETSGQTGGFQ